MINPRSPLWMGALFLMTALFVPALSRAGNLTGIVDDDTSAPLPGVTVTVAPLIVPGQTLAGTVTNASGAYAFTALADGDYEVTFDLLGFEPVRRAVTISGQTAARLDVALSFNVDARETGQRVMAPLGNYGGQMLAPFGAWNFGSNNLILYKLGSGTYGYGVAPSSCGPGTMYFDPLRNLDPSVQKYNDSLVQLTLSGGVVQSLLVTANGSSVLAQPVLSSGYVSYTRPLPPFTVVPTHPPAGMGCTPVYLYSEWVGGCLIDVYGCRPPLQNQVRSIACCFSWVPGEGGPNCEKFLGAASSE